MNFVERSIFDRAEQLKEGASVENSLRDLVTSCPQSLIVNVSCKLSAEAEFGSVITRQTPLHSTLTLTKLSINYSNQQQVKVKATRREGDDSQKQRLLCCDDVVSGSGDGTRTKHRLI